MSKYDFKTVTAMRAALEDVCQQMLHVQPGLLHTVLFQVTGTGTEGFEKGLHRAALFMPHSMPTCKGFRFTRPDFSPA